MRRILTATGLALAALAAPAHAAPVRIHVDGTIADASIVDGRLHVVGDFGRVSRERGGLAVVDATTGALLPHPGTDGPVSVLVPDGAGGTYVGGRFTRIGGVARTNLARIRSDGSVDPAFAPRVDGNVRDLAVDAGDVWIIGGFAHVGGADRPGMARIDGTTGAVRAWRTRAFDAERYARAIAVGDEAVWIGTATSADCSGDGVEEPLPAGCSGDEAALMAVDPATGARTGVANAIADVDDIAVAGGAVFWTAQGMVRGIVERTRDVPPWVDELEGLGSGWSLAPTPGGDVVAFSFDHTLSLLRAGRSSPVWTRSLPRADGLVGVVGTEAVLERNGQLTLARLADGATRTLDVPVGGPVDAVAATASGLLLGGSLRAIGGSVRRNAAAIDLATGEVTAWDPAPGPEVRSIVADRGGFLLGGHFRRVADRPAGRLVRVDRSTGALLQQYAPGGDVDDVVRAGDLLWAIGRALRGPGGRRAQLVALEPATGRVVLGRAAPRDGTFAAIVRSGRHVVVATPVFGRAARDQARAYVADRRARIAWTRSLPGHPWALVARRGGTAALVDGRRDRLVLLDGRGRPRRTILAPRGSSTLIAAGPALMVAGSIDGLVPPSRAGVTALNARTGRILPWRIHRAAETQGFVERRVIAAGAGTVAVVDVDEYSGSGSVPGLGGSSIVLFAGP